MVSGLGKERSKEEKSWPGGGKKEESIWLFNMLPKANQLKKKKDFEKVYKGGQGFKESFLYLKVAKNSLKNSRFGFVVSTKFSKKAPLRNKVKRRLREAVRAKLAETKKGLDVIITVKPGSEIADFQEIQEKVDKLFKKAKICD